MTTAPRCLALALAVLGLLGAAALDAQAAVCGDGLVDAGEACDAGSANGAFISCCTADCALRAAGETCRAATGPCDREETCDGATPECPADAVAPDADGDGVCDDIDLCPLAVDPTQTDDDGDGAGNACDPCTNVVPTTVSKAVLKLTKLLTGPGDDRLKLKLTGLAVPAAPALDPVANGARFLLSDALGNTIIDARLPGGQYSSGQRAGWKGTGSGWNYANGGQILPLIQGITKLSIKGRASHPGMFQIAVVGKNGSYGVAPGGLPVLATIVLDPPLATTGQCLEASFAPPRQCATSTSGAVTCK
jgi:hypothetical protein